MGRHPSTMKLLTFAVSACLLVSVSGFLGKLFKKEQKKCKVVWVTEWVTELLVTPGQMTVSLVTPGVCGSVKPQSTPYKLYSVLHWCRGQYLKIKAAWCVCLSVCVSVTNSLILIAPPITGL